METNSLTIQDMDDELDDAERAGQLSGRGSLWQLPFKNFDLDEIKDNLLPVSEQGQFSGHCRHGLRCCRLLASKSPKKRTIIETARGMFKSDRNTRYAITVLQFLQAAGMTKEELVRVKQELALNASDDLLAVLRAHIENAMLGYD